MSEDWWVGGFVRYDMERATARSIQVESNTGFRFFRIAISHILKACYLEMESCGITSLGTDGF